MKTLMFVALALPLALGGRSLAQNKVNNKGAKCKIARDCKGPLPDICEQCSNGHDECAHWSCVAGRCETQICPAPPPACKMAKDCKGPLPQICEQCPIGKAECAHWTCFSGRCEVQICPPLPPPSTQCKTANDCHGILPQ